MSIKQKKTVARTTDRKDGAMVQPLIINLRRFYHEIRRKSR